MSVSVALPAFLAGALVSLVTSWLLVSRLERVGERLGLSETLWAWSPALAGTRRRSPRPAGAGRQAAAGR